ncbi:MAG: hypothetical protein HOH20_00100 [Rhodospirillaceae bacterium]|jgi:hypothetical protein|nr:hypothetical protein [Rhodospirillaceae bacterium]MBT5564774.1 hypothetical protein [Rhodospirillaceae bacterium]MBT6087957.1 hypothetical protein [Rhodospirillaceae bacterium]MBT7672666.1 hypothetical protein [Pseudomonadota bacterium]
MIARAVQLSLFTLISSATVFSASDLSAQDDEKAVMLVQNYRSETITMDFSYVLADYSWQLMERDIGIDGDLTYKFPTNLPGCDYLIDWDIDNARLTVSNERGIICTKDVSICERKMISIEVRSNVCYMKSR